jgi:tetratricopeptide (TPR) repeat protein/tRNA A-37 threonylcarbamoyl transferase component Bud32
VTSDLRDRLQTTLGGAYSLEREIAGGGMSRVFVAEESALGRHVVIKVLAPDVVQDLSGERFAREIRVAASLQQANIVPVLSAGTAGGVPYYTMPLVEGESLRARLARDGPLAIPDVITIVRDIAKALAYAHEHGVVHRDIKPDNVLLSGGTAVVTDFGIAKAIAAAKSGNRPDGDSPSDLATGALTQLGTSLGTPAYMAPEQAAGDPATDHRADLYAFGITAYELLAGVPPFEKSSPHKVLAAHLSETPVRVDERRPDTPPALASLVMRCLAKDPSERPPSASAILDALAAVSTPSDDAHQALPAIRLATRRTLARALGLYAAGVVITLTVASIAQWTVGLPEWALPGALVLLVIGLPVILFTSLVQHGARVAGTTTRITPGGTRTTRSAMARLAVQASPWVSWRRAALGGVVAVGGFAILVAAYLTLRALGIGPAASLVAAGRIKAREPLLVTDFASPPNDSTLGAVVTEAMRTDLAESPAVAVVQPTRVKSALERMQVSGAPRLSLALAREVAEREGIRVILDGDIAVLGPTHVLSARLVTADSGLVLAAARATADGPKDIVGAIDQLSRKLRERLGESLRSVHTAPPLEQVTTASLPALRAYTAGKYAAEYEGDFQDALAQLREAVRIDTGFAMAYRKLASVYQSMSSQTSNRVAAIEQAYAHRDRLTSVERNITIGSYYYWGPAFDPRKSLEAFDAALAEQPSEGIAVDNAFDLATYLGDFERADQYARRELAEDSTSWYSLSNMLGSVSNLGDTARMQELLRRVRRTSGLQTPLLIAFGTAYLGQFDSATIALAAAKRAHPSLADVRSYTSYFLSILSSLHGQLRDADREARDAAEADSALGAPSARLLQELEASRRQIWFLERRELAVHMLDSAIARHPLASLPPLDRPYTVVAQLYALGGEPARARATMTAFDSILAGRTLVGVDDDRHAALGEIAIAERRYGVAVDEFRKAAVGFCAACKLAGLARAYDLAGQRDSAIAVYERYVRSNQFGAWPLPTAGLFLAGAHKRLGELYDANGETEKAVSHYAQFVELWKNADPELQPKVAEVRRRLADLSRSEGRKQ